MSDANIVAKTLETLRAWANVKLALLNQGPIIEFLVQKSQTAEHYGLSMEIICSILNVIQSLLLKKERAMCSFDRLLRNQESQRPHLAERKGKSFPDPIVCLAIGLRTLLL